MSTAYHGYIGNVNWKEKTKRSRTTTKNAIRTKTESLKIVNVDFKDSRELKKKKKKLGIRFSFNSSVISLIKHSKF